jgi:3-dehydroquinate dehydratase/shikimate dehydrogenase
LKLPNLSSEANKVRVCVPLCAKSFAALEQAYQRASEFADIVELRLDCLESDDFIADLDQLLARLSLPLILTYRPSEQGGYRVLNQDQRETFWNTDLQTLCDVEADLALTASVDPGRMIVSHHDFSGVPDDLEQIYERLAALPARIVKIAVQANDITDCIHIFKLLDRARSEQRELIAIAMGNAGIATRILGPSRGAFLTYGSLEDDSATAPGQVNARQLRSVYHVDEITDETMICGLIGMPVVHSVSPHMHNAAFAAGGIDGVYLPLEVRDVETFMKRMVHPSTRKLDWNLRGLSVTAPHKSSVMRLLDWVDKDAQEIGAVNTVVVEDGRLHGYNTDVYGLIEPLLERVGSLRGLSVAVIGAGGAARAAVWASQREQAKVVLFARAPNKARSLSEAFDVPCEQLSTASFAGYDVVINATPQSPANAEQLRSAGLVYDLIYNPVETEFMKEARAAGCQTLGGLPMLVAQARRQFEFWTGKTPSAELMHNAAAAALGQ